MAYWHFRGQGATPADQPLINDTMIITTIGRKIEVPTVSLMRSTTGGGAMPVITAMVPKKATALYAECPLILIHVDLIRKG
jgi:hypothetical protein